MPFPQGRIQLAQDSTGKNVRNLVVQAYVDDGDGNGPKLQTLYMQVAAVTLVDLTGNVVDMGELVDSDWKRMMLINAVATRIGMQELLSDTPNRNIDLMAEAGLAMEDITTAPAGSTEDT
jgi:hypothetical protein